MHHQETLPVDSYSLIKDLLANKQLREPKFIIDNQLPVIIGAPSQLEEIFKSFIDEAMLEFQNTSGSVYFEYINDPFPTICASLISNASTQESHLKETRMVKKITDFDLVILQPNHKTLIATDNFEPRLHFSKRQKTG